MIFSQYPISLMLSITILLSLITTTLSQQPYIREYGTDCSDQPRDTSTLGYLCHVDTDSSCPTFLSFRARPPYDTVAAVAAHLSVDAAAVARANSVATNSTFEANALVFVPVDCSCRGDGFYAYDTSYVADEDDNYFEIANVTFQGLTTCQAIANQTGNPPILNLQAGDKVKIPLRCACPTKNETDIGIKYLFSYITDEDDDDSKISDEFGVDNALFLKSNRLSDLDNTIYPDTTVLVPLRSWPPNSSQSLEPENSPPPPSAIQSPPPSSSSKTRLYVLIGALVGSLNLLILGIIFIVFFFKFRKGKVDKDDPEVHVSKSSTKENSNNQEVLKQVILSDVAGSLKVYDVEDLKLATNDFCPNCLIEGSVYRGKINGSLVAIKKIVGDVTKEINLLQKINHYNVVQLVGVCFDEGRWYMVYEYVSNGSLSDWLFRYDDDDENYSDIEKTLTWTQRVQIALDVATGLNYLHSFANPSQVHKDIKSSNILLDSDFRAKIANFGLSRSTKAQEGEFSVTNHIVGTIGYLAPEYLENGLVSPKLDVYAFGVVLLEMMTGKEVSVLYEEHRGLTKLFSGLISDEGLTKGVKEFLDVALREIYPEEVVVFVVRIIDGCLKKNPEVRPTMDEIVQFLSKALSHSITWQMSNDIASMSKYLDDKIKN